jgi:hypothetical protein
MEATTLTQEYLDKYYFEMFSKTGENACRSIVRSAWKKLAGPKRIRAQDMYEYLRARMNKTAGKYPEIWDTEPREKILYLVAKKAKEFDYDYSSYFGSGF